MPYPQPGDSTRLRHYLCPKCQTLLGLVNDAGELVIATIAVSFGGFRCLQCGHPKTWSHTDAQLSRLLEKVKRE